MKHKYKNGILSITLVVVIGLGATILGIIPKNAYPKLLQPFANVLVSLDEDYVDAPCTTDLCGNNDIEEVPVVDTVEPATPACTEDIWSCSEWNACTAKGVQTRNCTITKDCSEASTPSPSEEQVCVYHEPVIKDVVVPVVSRPAAPEVVVPQVVAPIAEVVSPDAKPAEVAAPVIPATKEDAKTIVEKALIEINSSQDNKVETAHLKEVQKVVAETPAFNSLLGKEGVKALEAEIVARQEQVPVFAAAQSKQEIALQKQEDIKTLAKVASDLLNSGADKAAIEVAVKQESKKISAVRTREQIHSYAAKQLNVDVKNNSLDEAKIFFGLTPKDNLEKVLFGLGDMPTPQFAPAPSANNMPTPQFAPAPGVNNMPTPQFAPAPGVNNMPTPQFAPAPGVNNMPTPDIAPAPDANLPIAMGVKNGSKFNKNEFIVNVSGPRGASVNIFATDRAGKESVIGSAVISDRNIAAVHVNQKLESGFVAMQARRADRVGENISSFAKASVLSGDEVATKNSSSIKIVELVNDELIEKPTVKNIQNVDISGLRDIKVSLDKEGKITVRGSADIESAVVGTFQSAVFTSAILADVNTGLFEVKSPESLENGDHIVTVYSTNPINGTQSKPVRVAFTIVGADDGTKKAVATTDAASSKGETQSNSNSLIAVSAGIGITLLVVLGLLMRKKDENEKE